jgi:hypothetical protein
MMGIMAEGGLSRGTVSTSRRLFLQRLAGSGPTVAYGVWLMQEQRNRVSTQISGLETARHFRKADSGKTLRAVEWTGTWEPGKNKCARPWPGLAMAGRAAQRRDSPV